MPHQDIETPTHRPPLDGGRIVADTFSIFFKGFFYFFPLGYAMQFASYAIVFLLYGDLGNDVYDNAGDLLVGKLVFTTLTETVGSSLSMSVVTLITFNYLTGGSHRFMEYILLTIACLLPITILMVISAVAIIVGMILLIIPGLYLAAMWSVYVPAILIDRVGFNGLRRSATLTENYRWSILLLLIPFIVVSQLFIAVPTTPIMAKLMIVLTPSPIDLGWTLIAVRSAADTIGLGISSIGCLIIFNRLKLIKEGAGIEPSLQDVFD